MDSDELRPFGDLFAVALRSGLTRPKAVRGAGTKMVNMGELFAHPRIADAPMDRVPLDGVDRERSLLCDGDLLFARQSLVLEGAGKCSIFVSDVEPVTFESHVIRARLDRDVADPDFYFYYFTSPRGRASVRSIVEQVAAAGIRGRDLAKLPVPVPPLVRQREVASVLRVLDDKIELNRRMNRTLESITRAIFKSWFVDFEPVRIKMEGRTRSEHRQSPSYAALFPDHLEPSPIGPVPGGWSVGPIGQFADLMIGGDWGQDLPCGECTEVACLRGVDIHNLRTSGWSSVPHRYVKRKSVDKRRPTDCDVLVEGSGACGRSIAYQPRIEKQLGVSVIYSNFCKRLRAATPAAAALIEFFLNDMVRSGEMLEFVTGTAMPNLDIHGLLRNRQIVMPDDGVLEAFGQVCEGWRSKLLSPESRALASLRDTLLPELLAGDRQTVQSEAATE